MDNSYIISLIYSGYIVKREVTPSFIFYLLVSDKAFKDVIHSASLPALSPRQGDE